MKHVASIGEAFEAFAKWFQTARPTYHRPLQQLSNGFEGWLKLEFYIWLIETYELTAGTDVGLEYRIRLDQRSRDMDRVTKQCDLWVIGPNDHFHYVEFKAPFADSNRNKLLDSAGHDFWYLTHARSYERAASANAVVVGVRFTEAEWRNARSRIRTAAGLETHHVPERTGLIADELRWDAWTHHFAT